MAGEDCKQGTIIAVVVVFVILGLSLLYYCKSKNRNGEKDNGNQARMRARANMMASTGPAYSSRYPISAQMMAQTNKAPIVAPTKPVKEKFVDDFTIDEPAPPIKGISTNYLGTIAENPFLGEKPASDFNADSYWIGAY
jgi:hypothetical protein